MNVLSLFDGISCGYEALVRAGVAIDVYYASEVDVDAMDVAKANHPDIIEIGDVRKVSYDSKKGILHSENGDFKLDRVDILMGGSPCTNFSSIGYAQGMVSGNTDILSLKQYMELKNQDAVFEGQSYLFWEYLRILNEVKPKWFLLENVEMSKKWERIIDDAVGKMPIKINSSLVSAQNRPRLYWTNIKNISIPEDKGVRLSDILDENADSRDVSDCLTIQRCYPRLMDKYGYIPERFNAYNAKEIFEQACTLSRGSMVTSSCAVTLFVPCRDGVHTVAGGMLNGLYPTKMKAGRYNLRRLSVKEMERLQTLSDGYVDRSKAGLSKKGQMIGNGWTVDIISHIFSHIPKEE